MKQRPPSPLQVKVKQPCDSSVGTVFPTAKTRKYRVDRAAVRRAQIIDAIPGYTINGDPLLTEKEAAAYIAMSSSTLQRWRSDHPDRIPFIKVGSHRVRYRRSALDNFLNAQTVTDGAGVKHG